VSILAQWQFFHVERRSCGVEPMQPGPNRVHPTGFVGRFQAGGTIQLEHVRDCFVCSRCKLRRGHQNIFGSGCGDTLQLPGLQEKLDDWSGPCVVGKVDPE